MELGFLGFIFLVDFYCLLLKLDNLHWLWKYREIIYLTEDFFNRFNAHIS